MDLSVKILSSAEQRADNPRTQTGSSSIRVWLIRGLVVEVILFLPLLWLHWNLLVEPSLVRATQVIQRWRKTQLFDRLMRGDPVIGSIAPSNSRISLVRSKHSARYYVVVFSGNSSCCTRSLAQSLDRVAQERSYVRVMMVILDTQEGVDAIRRTMAVDFEVLPDSDGSLSRAYNAFWLPRAYIPNKEGRLVWIQKREGVDLQSAVLEGLDRG